MAYIHAAIRAGGRIALKCLYVRYTMCFSSGLIDSNGQLYLGDSLWTIQIMVKKKN